MVLNRVYYEVEKSVHRLWVRKMHDFFLEQKSPFVARCILTKMPGIQLKVSPKSLTGGELCYLDRTTNEHHSLTLRVIKPQGLNLLPGNSRIRIVPISFLLLWLNQKNPTKTPRRRDTEVRFCSLTKKMFCLWVCFRTIEKNGKWQPKVTKLLVLVMTMLR